MIKIVSFVLLLGIGSAFAQTGQCPPSGCTTVTPPPVCTVTTRACVVSGTGQIVSCTDTVSSCPVPPTPPTTCTNNLGQVVPCP